MLAQTSLSILILLARVVLSTEEKPEDCIKGKQYWSTTFIDPSGACVACPPNYESCRTDEPYEDQKRCEDSCRVIEITKKPPSINTKPPSPPTSDIPKATPSPSIPNVVFVPAATKVEPNKNKDEPSSNKRSDGSGHWPIWLQAVVASILSCFAVACLVVVPLLVLRARRKKALQERREVGGNNGEGLPLNEIPNDEEQGLPPNADREQRLQPNDRARLPQPNSNGNEEQHLQRPNKEEHVARQETQPVQSGTSKIVGIQEDHFQSSLNVQPEYEN